MVLRRALWQPTYRYIGEPSGFISGANLDDGPSAVYCVFSQHDVSVSRQPYIHRSRTYYKLDYSMAANLDVKIQFIKS